MQVELSRNETSGLHSYRARIYIDIASGGRPGPVVRLIFRGDLEGNDPAGDGVLDLNGCAASVFRQ